MRVKDPPVSGGSAAGQPPYNGREGEPARRSTATQHPRVYSSPVMEARAQHQPRHPAQALAAQETGPAAVTRGRWPLSSYCHGMRQCLNSLTSLAPLLPPFESLAPSLPRSLGPSLPPSLPLAAQETGPAAVTRGRRPLSLRKRPGRPGRRGATGPAAVTRGRWPLSPRKLASPR